MRVIATALFCLATALLVGCPPRATNPKPDDGQNANIDPQPLPSPETTAEVRKLLLKIDPTALIGTVASALPENNLVSVTDAPFDKFAVGNPLTFFDVGGKRIADGSVLRVLPDAIHASYAPAADGRAPRAGDVAVHLRKR